MDAWIKIVGDPLGLAGFALFLGFSLLAKTRSASRAPWLTASFITLAGIALLGGLGLAYLRQRPALVSPVATPAPPARSVEQQTSGPQSPAVGGVDGDVSITIKGAPPQKRTAPQ
jgi:hypothetical protein